MKKKAILQMLRDLLQTAAISETDPDDLSGLSTRYYVDQEQLLRNIESELEDIETCSECGGLGETVDSSPCHKCHGYG